VGECYLALLVRVKMVTILRADMHLRAKLSSKLSTLRPS